MEVHTMNRQRGFTLIELLVVIAIMGVIATIVALNVAGFFGRGTLEAANSELHQAQTAIVSAMTDCESVVNGSDDWSGQAGVVTAFCWNGTPNTPGDAAYYCYGPFRAQYTVQDDGRITNGACNYPGGWGNSIVWNSSYNNWQMA